MIQRFFLLAALMLAACSSSSRPALVGTDAVDDTYVLGGGALDTGAQFIVAAAPRDFDGQLVICGLRLDPEEGGLLSFATSDILGQGRIEQNGETVLKGFNKFPEIPARANLAGAQTACFTTGLNWSAAPISVTIPAYEIRSSRQRVVRFAPLDDIPRLIGPPPTTAPDPEPAAKPGQWQVAE